MLRTTLEVTVFLLIALALFILAFRPELRAGISDSALFSVLSTALIAAGAYHLGTARGRAGRMSQQLTNASPLRRLWFPARFYTGKNLLWQFRLLGAMMVAAGVMTAFAAFLACRHGF